MNKSLLELLTVERDELRNIKSYEESISQFQKLSEESDGLRKESYNRIITDLEYKKCLSEENFSNARKDIREYLKSIIM